MCLLPFTCEKEKEREKEKEKREKGTDFELHKL
jgi:hypothetical protein